MVKLMLKVSPKTSHAIIDNFLGVFSPDMVIEKNFYTTACKWRNEFGEEEEQEHEEIYEEITTKISAFEKQMALNKHHINLNEDINRAQQCRAYGTAEWNHME